MPQTDIFVTDHDLYQLVQFLLDQNCRIVPDLNYKEPSPLLIDSMREFENTRTIQEEKLFFVLNKSWQKSPLDFGQYEKEGHTIYYIKQKNGGPTLDIYAPLPIVHKDNVVLPHGFIAYHGQFWNPVVEANETAPDPLKSAYLNARKFLRRNAMTRKANKRTYVIAANARKKLEEGYALGAPFESE
ncbi:hypothetical protein [Bremerella alba]|uniref:Uncharacterized protein n=1 Tax=Bremerella alba TaxID=980252 RepID=A0A7V9A9X0_9BACT|nr:hypothetical protein [Bremerella alba]MBA2117917.1 hypothetical protein [Bremerella alba]